MSSQFLSMQVPLRGCGTNFCRTRRRFSPDEPPREVVRIGSTPAKLKCVAVVANPAFPIRSAEELQEVYGSQGLNFLDFGGSIFADLKLENGCRARLALDTAQIVSYKAHMWHGGEEELLHGVRSVRGESPLDYSLRGGINLRFFHSQDPQSSILPPSTEWSVEAVRCEPSNYAQITLTTSSNAEGGRDNGNQGCLQFRYVVTLTDRSLSSAIVVTNAGLRPLEFKGSIVNHLAISSVEGTFAVGLNGCSYLSFLSTPTQQSEMLSEAYDFFPPIWGSERNTRLDLPATSTTSPPGRTEPVGDSELGRWMVEKEDYSELHGGEARLYPTPPSSLTVLDRGFRRSLIVQRLGFQEFWLSNPGEGSKLRDWDDFMCLGPTQNTQSVVLLGKEKWRAAQILTNPGYD